MKKTLVLGVALTPFVAAPLLAQVPDGTDGGKRPGRPDVQIPEIPADKLPPRSAPPPDPAREQYRREKVHLRISERVKPKERPVYDPDVRVLENYLAEYFRRAGFEVVAPEEAQYRIEGHYEARFHSAIVFKEQTIAHKYVGSARVRVLGKKGKGTEGDLEVVEVPEFFADGIQSPDTPEERVAVLEMRRRLAKVIWERLYHTGKTFAHPEVPRLITSLTVDNPEAEVPVRADDVLQALVSKRFQAVPYLIEALSDEREVRVEAKYPGLTLANLDKLRVHHLADKALEEIFQKVSRMDLQTPTRARFRIIKGWEKEWERFCPPYRESPERRAALKKPAGPASGEAGAK